MRMHVLVLRQGSLAQVQVGITVSAQEREEAGYKDIQV